MEGYFKKNKIFCVLLAASMVFLFGAKAQKIAAACEPHHDHYSLDNGNPGYCGATITDWDVPGSEDDGCGSPYRHYSRTCEKWQSPVPWQETSIVNNTCINRDIGYICACDQNCLSAQKNPVYYDRPDASGNPQNENSVTLPVLLTWVDPNNHHKARNSLTTALPRLCGPGGSWLDYADVPTDCSGGTTSAPPTGTNSYLVDFLVYYLNDEKDTSKRLIRFDQSEPPNSNSLTPPNPNGTLVNGIGPNGQTAKILEFIINPKNGEQQQFNSRTDGWPCFFNSDAKIYWRVRPCCDKNGQGCMPEKNAVWWSFKTVSAPEPLGITDNVNYKNLTPDPDWNGPKTIENVDFCSVVLKWCSAKVDPLSKESVFQQNIGHNQALSYQMMIGYNEKSQVTAYNNFINSLWRLDIWGTIKGLAEIAAPYLGLNYTSSKANQCHYLLVDTTNPNQPVCRAEIITPHTTLAKTPATVFSNAQAQNFNRGIFTKNIQYDWTLRRCFDNPNAGNESCQQNIIDTAKPLKEQNFGQTWSITTLNQVNVTKPLLATPSDDAETPIEIEPTLAWKPQCGANSFEYQLKEGQNILLDNHTIASQVKLAQNTPSNSATIETALVEMPLKLDTVYQWRVRGCWPSVAIKNADNSASFCGDDSAWTKWFSFRTTGMAPKNLKVIGDNDANIPAMFSWDKVGGALSYLLQISDSQGETIKKIVPAGQDKTISQQVLYPDLKPNKNYSWTVKTCADDKANNCGNSATGPVFATKTLPPPAQAVSPRNASSVENYPNQLSWTPVKGASGYYVTLSYNNNYVDPQTMQTVSETGSDCPKNGQLFAGATNENKYQTSGIKIPCLGTYTWTVASCLTATCTPNNTIGTAAEWRFFIKESGGKPNSGLIVCGRRDDDPTTAGWDERHPCQAQDLFEVLRRLINLALFQISIWLLPILAVITGIIFYTHYGAPDTLKLTKRMWKYIGIGYGLLFFAWMIVNWIMYIMGYHQLWYKIF